MNFNRREYMHVYNKLYRKKYKDVLNASKKEYYRANKLLLRQAGKEYRDIYKSDPELYEHYLKVKKDWYHNAIKDPEYHKQETARKNAWRKNHLIEHREEWNRYQREWRKRRKSK